MRNGESGVPYRVSVVISTRNRASLLDATLSYLAKQTLTAGAFEVVVADNGSDDATPDVLASWQGKLPLQTVYEPTPGKNRALNRVLPLTRGKLLVFTDDDIVPCSNWLDELDQSSERWPDDSIFGGKITLQYPEGTLPFLRDPQFPPGYAYSRFDLGLPEGPMKSRSRPCGANVAIRRKVFDEWSFNETIGPAGKNYVMGSETELLNRLADAGFRMIYVPTATVEHVIGPHQLTLKWLEGRAYRYGRMQARLFGASDSRMLWNVPRYLWRKVGELWLASLGARIIPTRKKWHASMHYFQVRGTIDEFRAMHQESLVEKPEDVLTDGPTAKG